MFQCCAKKKEGQDTFFFFKSPPPLLCAPIFCPVRGEGGAPAGQAGQREQEQSGSLLPPRARLRGREKRPGGTDGHGRTHEEVLGWGRCVRNPRLCTFVCLMYTHLYIRKQPAGGGGGSAGAVELMPFACTYTNTYKYTHARARACTRICVYM